MFQFWAIMFTCCENEQKGRGEKNPHLCFGFVRRFEMLICAPLLDACQKDL
uniref:Uncharacterized protein n=1 Tax=Arundo donax TaxID=35708 RepID=A0A0A9EN93_ARUDO